MDQHEAWEQLAASFDATRDRTWPQVEAFVQSLPGGARVLDLMAGNGRHQLLRDDVTFVWCDWSRPMARRVAPRVKGPLVVADATRLPFRDASFDAALCTAGLHGLAERKARIAVLEEAYRCMQPGGRMHWTLWAKSGPKFRGLEPVDEPLLLTVPWRRDGLDVPRTYYLHTEESLAEEVAASSWIVESIRTIDVTAPGARDNLELVTRRPES